MTEVFGQGGYTADSKSGSLEKDSEGQMFIQPIQELK